MKYYQKMMNVANFRKVTTQTYITKKFAISVLKLLLKSRKKYIPITVRTVVGKFEKGKKLPS